MIYLQLWWSFVKVGLLSFGGGYAALPLIQQEVYTHHWLHATELNHLITLSQMTPGPIAINAATFVGVKSAGITGAIVATLGLVTPSVIIIMLISKLLKKFRDNIWVDSVLSGIRPAVIALILFAGLEVAKLTIIDWKTLLMFALFWCAIHFYKKSPIFYIVISAVVGIVFQL